MAETDKEREVIQPSLPPAPGPGATHDEWRTWAEAIIKAAKAAGYDVGE